MNDPSGHFGTPDEILNAALKKEQAAHAFYGRLLARTRIPMVRELLERLKDEEYRHMHLIRKMLAELRGG